MKPNEFLKLIDAPWSAYHDHPDPETAASLASIRPTGAGCCNEVASVYLCDYDADGIGAMQRARRDLITAAPDLYAYVATMAATGDTQAKLLLRSIHGEQS